MQGRVKLSCMRYMRLLVPRSIMGSLCCDKQRKTIMNHYYHIKKRKLKTNHDIRTSTMHIPYQLTPYLTPRSDVVMKSRRRNICIDPGDQSETAYLLMTTSAGTRTRSQRRKQTMWGVEDPAQEHQFPQDHKIYSVPMGKTTTLQVERSMALLQAERAYMLRRRSFLIFIFVLFHSMR